MQHLITMPKSLGGSKAERKARIQTNGQTAMIDTADMLRVTGMKPMELLHTMPEFHLTARLAKAERDWPEIQKAYAKSPELFEALAIAGGPASQLILSLVQTNRTPADAVAAMDTRLVKHLVQAHCAADETAATEEKEDQAVCTACGTHGARLRCSACKEMACITVLYCTKECQLADWKARHKKVCCKTRLPKASADSLKTLMAPEEVGVAAKVALLQGVMEACANVH